MPRDNRFFDYEYNDEEFLERQKRNASRQNNVNRRAAPAASQNAQNRYKTLAEQSQHKKNDDVKLYRPKGQAPRQSAAVSNSRINQRPAPQSKKQTPPPAANKKKKRGGIGRFLRNLLIFVLVIYLAASAYVFSLVSNVTFNRDDRTGNPYISSTSLKKDMFVENILFIGVDSRGEENSRSDTMMLVSIDKKHHKLKLTSFLRDTYVTVPGHGEMKLNAACFYGGPKLVVDTIEYNFGIDIDHYMLVDFEAFIQIVDALGGTDVEVTASEAEYMRTAVKVPWVKEGMNHFNGFVTLWYCRIRYLDNDFYRTQRQRKVISCLLEQAKKQNPFTLMNTVKEAMPYIQTDMSALKMTSLIEGTGLFYMHYDMLQQQIPYSDEYENRIINEQMVLYIDIPSTSRKIIEFIYE
ncbi:MAG: LCP family protein [Clostridia bacterium]|nr:LCP family protein [Clostridia bacterium]